MITSGLDFSIGFGFVIGFYSDFVMTATLYFFRFDVFSVVKGLLNVLLSFFLFCWIEAGNGLFIDYGK
jgi:hypothetical protein